MSVIQSLLEAEHSKNQVVEVTKYIGDDKSRVKELMELVLGKDKLMRQRASWVLAQFSDKKRPLISGFEKKIVQNLYLEDLHDAVIRNSLKLFEKGPIDEDLEDDLCNLCFKYLESNEYPVAIKVFSLSILEQITKKYLPLQSELINIIEDQLPYSSAGFQSRGKKILKRLKQP